MPFRHFLKRGLVFASPLLVWALIVVVVDPFDYFDIIQLVPEQVKLENAKPLNSMMFNMLKEVHHPSENLIIGDSRVEDLSLEQIEQKSGLPYSRLSANALKLNEAVDLFWFANRQKHLKHVVFGINFNQYNEYAYADREQSVEAIVHNPLIYVFDRSVAQTVYYVVKACVSGKRAFSSAPPMSRDEFWNYIVSTRGREHYGRYRYPQALYTRIQEMIAFGKTQGTEITFIVVPHHADFQRRVREFGLVDEYIHFKRDMSRLGVRVIDYDYANEITSRKDNFADPLHYNAAIGRLIVDEVFRGPLVQGRLMTSAWVDDCSRFLY